MARGIRYTAEQMSSVVRELEAGKPVLELSRIHGISDKTIYKWRTQFKGMKTDEIKKMRQLEEENSRLKRMIANMAIDIDALKAINAKKW